MKNKTKASSLAKGGPYLLIVAFWAVAPLFFTSRFWLNNFINVFTYTIAAVSLRTLSLSGNMSFAHGAFLGVGAYTAGILTKLLGLPAIVAIPAGAILALIIGVATGLPFVRLRSIYFCMASMFLGVAIIYVITAWNTVTGGSNGMNRIPAMFRNLNANYYYFLILAVVSCGVMYRFEHSRIGTILQALSQSHTVAASIGISERYFRLLAVGVGCFFAGLAGSSYALYSTVLSPNSFNMNCTLYLIMYVMIGGQDQFIGPIIGTALLVLLPEVARSWSTYAPYATAAALILVAYLLPGGIASLPSTIKAALEKRKLRRALTEQTNGGGDTDAA